MNSVIIKLMKKEVELPKKTEEQIKMRDKKHAPKMKVSGKSVFKLKGLIINSPRQGRGK